MAGGPSVGDGGDGVTRTGLSWVSFLAGVDGEGGERGVGKGLRFARVVDIGFPAVFLFERRESSV